MAGRVVIPDTFVLEPYMRMTLRELVNHGSFYPYALTPLNLLIEIQRVSAASPTS